MNTFTPHKNQSNELLTRFFEIVPQQEIAKALISYECIHDEVRYRNNVPVLFYEWYSGNYLSNEVKTFKSIVVYFFHHNIESGLQLVVSVKI